MDTRNLKRETHSIVRGKGAGAQPPPRAIRSWVGLHYSTERKPPPLNRSVSTPRTDDASEGFMTMTCIHILAGVLFLSALAESAIVDRWEYREVYFQKINETSEDLQELEALLEEQLPGLCWACKWIVKKARKLIGDNKTPDRMRDVLNRVCDQIGFLKSQCKRFLGKVMDTLVEELSTTDSPQQACINLNACK
uniref:Saposin B-type domain-containing protein n=1 Tax=Paramormyrops kingsleyae TaxID=1676925 RepID=A0A3B3R1T0_9TELE